MRTPGARPFWHTLRRLRSSLLNLLVVLAISPLQAQMRKALAPAPFLQLAPGVFVWPGNRSQAETSNAGRVGNASVIVGPTGVLVVDSGSSYAHGLNLIQTIRETTTLPIRALLLTHTRPEFIFGAQAFQDAGVPVWMHLRSSELMAARCALCLSRLQQTLGAAEMNKTRIVRPDRHFEGSFTSHVIGRPLQIHDFGHSSGPGAVAVWDAQTATLIAGGLLDHLQIPDLRDAEPLNWLRALDALSLLPIERVIPGHGPAAGGALLAQQRHYLNRLRLGVQDALQRGVSLGDMAGEVPMSDVKDWDGYPQQHVQNLMTVYLHHERAWMTAP